MDIKHFKLWNKITAGVTFVVAAVTYLCTIEPTASFWDCGEFIASSYKLEVGHPPGNPVFQLFAKVFTLLGGSDQAAILVNSLSAICSALTILLLYLTIVWFVKRLITPDKNGEYSLGASIAIYAAGAVGALAYCFSDTFWFSAVEGEVYAMSSLFTALVFWLMTLWYDRADEAHNLRWIVLIAFLMGLSIGIHLLNLLAIPALVFMYYFRKKETCTPVDYLKIFLIGVVILAIILFGIIPWLPKLAAYFDLAFVNILGLPYNSGAAFFMLALLGLCFWGIWKTMQKGKVFWNTVLMCFTVITIGFSFFAIDVIRSSAKTPTNEYQPDNAFTLVRYLSREQYGKTPLIYGQYYGSEYDIQTSKYWAPVDGKYKKVEGPMDAKYEGSDKMLFPRMWSPSPGGDGSYEDFYAYYTKGKKGKPSMGANLRYFFDYQCNWMYWRYFMWNFAGRQNDVHSPTPGNIFHGNWESGIKFIDEARLGDQSDAPELLKNNKGKNHYFFLPLLLGIIGLCFQFRKDKRGCFLTFLMFFMTGIAIVLYLNQPPYQVRERDYAYAGSFYFFSVWIGLGAAALYNALANLKGNAGKAAGATVAVLCLGVPTLMAEENWDDHDRSNRRTTVETATNYLNSVGQNGILITHGDNDTFPLWYAQEVEGIRTDVRIVNTSLLGTDWHIDQMKYAVNESAPLNLTIPHSQYLYGTNEYVPIVDNRGTAMDISTAMEVFKHPKAKVSLSSGRKVDYLPARKLIIPVNKENVLKSGIVSPEYADKILDQLVIEIPAGKDYLSKPELFLLDFLSNYDWSRPLNMINKGGDLNVGIKEYLVYEGYSYKLVPFKNSPQTLKPGFVDLDELYSKMTDTFKYDALSRNDYFIDYQNYYTHLGVMSISQLFVTAATVFNEAKQYDRALEMLDRMCAALAPYPYDAISIGFSTNDYMFIEAATLYYKLGASAKGEAIAEKLADELIAGMDFYEKYQEYAPSEYQSYVEYTYLLMNKIASYADKSIVDRLEARIKEFLKD